MARFMTRVELHNAQAQDYTALHNAMARQGFSRKIQGSDGVNYQLPTAEYTIVSELSASDIVNKGAAAAKTVKPSFDIIATKSDGIAWQLRPVA